LYHPSFLQHSSQPDAVCSVFLLRACTSGRKYIVTVGNILTMYAFSSHRQNVQSSHCWKLPLARSTLDAPTSPLTHRSARQAADLRFYTRSHGLRLLPISPFDICTIIITIKWSLIPFTDGLKKSDGRHSLAAASRSMHLFLCERTVRRLKLVPILCVSNFAAYDLQEHYERLLGWNYFILLYTRGLFRSLGTAQSLRIP